MFSNDEQKVIDAPSLQGFPLMKAVSEAVRACKTCRKGKVNPRSMLRLAMERNSRDTEFVIALSKVIALPSVVGGVLFNKP